MGRSKNFAGRENEQGIIITLVAVFMLCVIGAMAALSIDLATLYTARSEAQLAADSAALAGARVLANSGMTSKPTDAMLTSNAETLASAVATQVAQSNQVGGRNLVASNGEVTLSFPNVGSPDFGTNPHVTVQVKRTDLPTFFARIWGTTQLTVGASATAEAYNPSGGGGPVGHTPQPPVAPMCVKPWLLPNIDPVLGTGNPIFDSSTGAIVNPALLNQGWPTSTPGGNTNGLRSRGAGGTPQPGRYYAGAIDAADFPVPTQALPACSAGFTAYQLAVAGCVSNPISCGGGATIKIDTGAYAAKTGSRNGDTVEAAECLIHYNGAVGDTDSIDTTALPSPPFQFLGGNQNPVSGAIGKDVLVSDSIVTIPVYDSAGAAPTNPVTVIGFVQVFLNPTAALMPYTGTSGGNQIPVTIINMAGCGTGATGQPILGNGASPVAVRLISPP